MGQWRRYVSLITSYLESSHSLHTQVTYQHLTCAGKKLHEVLIEAGNDGVDGVVHKYLQECQLMSSLRHPNITQFLGLCFLPGTQLPLLVMERLETSLDDLLEHIPNLPLSLSLSLSLECSDVASGHNRPSPCSYTQGPDLQECPPYLLSHSQNL